MNYFKKRGITIWYILYFMLVFVLVWCFGIYKCIHPEEGDIVNEIFPGLDGWMCTHFITYTIVGVIWPDSIVLTIIISIVWEMLETTLGTLNQDFKRNTDCH